MIKICTDLEEVAEYKKLLSLIDEDDELILMYLKTLERFLRKTDHLFLYWIRREKTFYSI